jgi:hypothetical protein
MATALNFTAPLKQDRQTQAGLQHLEEVFAEEVQPLLEKALAESETVHFARVLVIDDKYLQVLTEFDGPPDEYAEFFRKELGSVFQQIFSLVDGAPPWSQLNEKDVFYKFTKKFNVKAFGTSPEGDESRGDQEDPGDPEYRGYLFSAVGNMTVREIKEHLRQQSAAAG